MVGSVLLFVQLNLYLTTIFFLFISLFLSFYFYSITKEVKLVDSVVSYNSALYGAGLNFYAWTYGYVFNSKVLFYYENH